MVCVINFVWHIWKQSHPPLAVCVSALSHTKRQLAFFSWFWSVWVGLHSGEKADSENQNIVATWCHSEFLFPQISSLSSLHKCPKIWFPESETYRAGDSVCYMFLCRKFNEIDKMLGRLSEVLQSAADVVSTVLWRTRKSQYFFHFGMRHSLVASRMINVAKLHL